MKQKKYEIISIVGIMAAILLLALDSALALRSRLWPCYTR